MDKNEKDLEFLEEYYKLCSKYDKCIECNCDCPGENLIVIDGLNGAYIYTEKELEDRCNERLEKIKEELELKKKQQEEENKKRIDDYINNGGMLNIHEEIPSPFPENYCGQIKGIRWGRDLAEFNKATKCIIDILSEKMYTSKEIQNILKEIGIPGDTTKEAITELWERGVVSFTTGFEIFLVDRPVFDD